MRPKEAVRQHGKESHNLEGVNQHTKPSDEGTKQKVHKKGETYFRNVRSSTTGRSKTEMG